MDSPEVIEAINTEDSALLRAELGDVLLQVVFHARIEQEKDVFGMEEVSNDICAKLIHRHPHVFGEVKADDAEAVADNWEKIKLREKGGNKSVLSGVPRTLPALIKAFRIQEKAAHVGFDWDKPEQVWDKVKEEECEVESEIASKDKDALEAEFGDLLFAVVNAARKYGVNPENALERTNRKFISRFEYIEAGAAKMGKKPDEMTLEEMDALWNEAKANADAK